MNRNANTIFGFVAAVVLILSGCINNVDTETGGNSNVPDGKCSLTVDSGFSARAAFPSSLAADMVYAAEISYSSSGAKKWLDADSLENSPAVLRNSPSASGEIRFVFCAPEESAEYTITVFACSAGTSVGSAADVENAAAASGQAEFSLEAGQKAIETPVKVSLSPVTNKTVSGTGSVKLQLSFNSALGIAAAKVNVTKDGKPDSDGNNYGFKIEVSGSSATLSAEDAPAGTYLAIMKFNNSTSTEVAVNSAVQQVSVYPGMTTDCWFIDGKKHGTTEADGTFKPSALELTKYDFTELYVLGSDAASGETDGKLVFYNEEHFGNSIPTITNVNDGDGSMTNPFATVQKAVDKITAAGDTSKKYTIYVDGTITADSSDDFKNDELDKTFIYIKSSNKLDLTIKGFSKDSKAVLDANQKDTYGGNVLSASKNVSLTLENLKITGGKRVRAGGGIYANGNLTLKKCLVTNNISNNAGGGIRFNGTQLIIEESEVSNNKGENEYSAGGGIDADGNVTIKKSNICNNSTSGSSGGGGVYFSDFNNKSTIIDIQDSKISNNSAKNGAGIYFAGGKELSIKSTEINENIVTDDGGGIYFYTGKLKLSGEIVFSNENDIFLNDNVVIDIDNELSIKNEYEYVARITPITYKPRKLLQVSNSELEIKNEVLKFELTKQADTEEFFINEFGYLTKPTALSELEGEDIDFEMYSKLIVKKSSDMNKLAELVNNGKTMQGSSITLMENVTLDNSFVTIGGYDSSGFPKINKPYSGIFDGNKKTISSGSSDCDSIFGYVKNGIVKNLNTSGKFQRSGIVSILGENSTIDSCVNESYINGNNLRIGGIVGEIQENSFNVNVINCTNKGNVKTIDNGFVGPAGGICGAIYSDNDNTIENCENYGSVTGKQYVGGICGSSVGNIKNCKNVDSATSEIKGNWFVGGICGNNSGFILNCKNSISVEGNQYVGGICGDNSGFIANSTNYNNVYTGTDASKYDCIGGIVGTNSTKQLEKQTGVFNCINIGDITCFEDTDFCMGGIFGEIGSSENETNGFIKNCVNLGSVSYETSNTSCYVGYIGGKRINTYELSNTYYFDNTNITIDKVIGDGDSVSSNVASSFDSYLKTPTSLTVSSTTSNELIDLLNAWVDKENNLSGTTQYLKWKSVGNNPSLVYE